MHNVDLSQAKCLYVIGEKEQAYIHPISICWKCALPTGDCRWLLNGVAPAGSEYISCRVHHYGPENENYVYIMRHCPHHERAKRNDE